MGNDQSHIKGIEIDKKAIESTDFWSIYNGELKNENGPTTLITIFQGEQVVKGQLWTNKSPLERATRNFKLYRHPAILRFITSFEKGSVHYLATERCKPLSMVLATQNDTQICLGLRNVLQALIFLVEKANMTHLNICMSSIYVNASGSWRLGGFEHLWTKKEANQALLECSQPYRYAKSLDKDESKRDSTSGIETFAFGVLCEEILNNRRKSASIPNVAEFQKYCGEQLQNTDVSSRPNLSTILSHSYFNQDFILIHSFLTELPLKNQLEKQSFFTSLVDRLRQFDETVIATELIDLILSRIVLLDETAKLCVLPFVLQPRIDCDSDTSAPISPIFSAQAFTKFVAPKISQLFLVRDVQIRLILLDYFGAYMDYFSSNEVLTKQILPQLLLGIKDTNDQLVAATLRCLADLVPVLGSSVVIGSNRSRIFADGKPNSNSFKWAEVRSITPIMNGAGVVSSSPMPTDTGDVSDSFVSIVNSQTSHVNRPDREMVMPERLSPDGADEGEGLQSFASEQVDDDDGWSDWETDQPSNEIHQTESTTLDYNPELIKNDDSSTTVPGFHRNISVSSSNSTTTNQNNESFIKDIKDLDIKPFNKPLNDEIDFFKDMEPVIAMPSSITTVLNTQLDRAELSYAESKRKADNDTNLDRFAVTTVEDSTFDEAAWGDEADDWDN